MVAKPKFSILLFTDSPDQGAVLEKFIKPAFNHFFVVETEADAVKVIVDEGIDILLMGLSSIAENESAFLHLISTKEADVGSIIKRKFLLCGQNEIREAFSVCNKEIFDDYFITRPLYDPYHILIRLRFLMRLFRQQAQEAAEKTIDSSALKVEDLCTLFDKIIHCEQSFTESSDQSIKQLLASVSTALEQLKAGISEGDMSDKQRAALMTLVENGTQKSLLQEVETQQQQQAQMCYQLQSAAESARVKKQQAQDPQTLDLNSVNLLLVEQEAETRERLAQALSAAGCSVQAAPSAKAAVEFYQQTPAEVMLIDIKLSDMSPFFVINRVKTLNPDVKIILLARPVDRGNADECLKAGANDVLIKPVDEAVMVYKIHELIS